MKATTREYAKQIITDCQIKRLTRAETLDVLRTKGIDIGETTLKKMKREIKTDARDWITNLAKNRDDYIAQYKQSIDTYRMLQHEAFEVIRDQRSGGFVKIQALLAIGKFEENINELKDAEPVVMALKDYTGLSTEPTDGDTAVASPTEIQQ